MKTIRIVKMIPKAVSRGEEAVQSILPDGTKKWIVSYHFKTGLKGGTGSVQHMTAECSGYHEWDALRALCGGTVLAGGIVVTVGMIRKMKKAAQTHKIKKELKKKWLRRCKEEKCHVKSRPRLTKKRSK